MSDRKPLVPDQVCLVVKDRDRTIEFLSRVFGWGPFDCADTDLEGFVHRGETRSAKVKYAMGQLGVLRIEILEVVEGETCQSEFLREHGIGVQHLGVHVADLDAALEDLDKHGIKPIVRHSVLGLDYAHVAAEELGSLTIELHQPLSGGE